MNLYASIKHLGLPKEITGDLHGNESISEPLGIDDDDSQNSCVNKGYNRATADWIEALKGIEVKDGKFERRDV